MDAIDTIDWGAYAHFTFVAGKHPDAIRFVQAHYHQGTYILLIGLNAAALLLLLVRKRLRAAIVASLGFIAALGMIELCRLLVPRHRPPDARALVDANDMLGSYPSADVYLFMLTMIYFGFALWPWLRTGVSRSVFLVVAAALTVGVALSQFFLATHFVSDVVGGIVGAAIVGFTVAKFFNPTKAPSIAA
jgi:membrane-associated phospholipid phosphatase